MPSLLLALLALLASLSLGMLSLVSLRLSLLGKLRIVARLGLYWSVRHLFIWGS
jgi:hypothetical protein